MSPEDNCDVCTNMKIIQKVLQTCHQVHLLNFYNALSGEEKKAFCDQLGSIDFMEANSLFEEAVRVLDDQMDSPDKVIEPVPISEFGSALTCGEEKLKSYWKSGLEAISQGKLAALVLSGGQGTRLGMNIPKGMISIGLPSGKTILQVQIEKIRRLQKLSSKFTKNEVELPLYILTSHATHEQIETFLKESNYFKMKEQNVILFQQGFNPCFTLDGKIILANKGCVATAPDGTGGLYQAMEKKGIFEDLTKRGVEYVHVYPVDNIMTKVADPIFLGYCIEQKTDCAAKVLKKHDAKQNVGNVCKIDGAYGVVEYSEISDELASQTDANGELLFNSASICIHMFTVNFMKEMAWKKLKPHVAKKKVPFVDESGIIRTPTDKNAIKVERFVFEAFQYARNFVTWEVGHDEFSPIKNSNTDKYECPLTARTDLLSMHRTYIENLGGIVGHADVEISPLVSYAGEDLGGIVKGVKFVPFSATHIQNEEEYQDHQVDMSFKPFSKLFNIIPTMIRDG